MVGIGCRYPGGIVDERSFWEVLAGERDVIREVPPERWSIDDLYHPDPDNEGTMVTRCGGFLRGIEEFDAPFFGISAREAEHLDPQQRLVLECTWEALENAGIIPKALTGTPTGVFMGLIYQEYAQRVPDLKGVDGYTLTGNTASVASGRVSYLLGLEGPSLTVDTACSSSLMALHLACESLARGECNLAVAGGVTVMLTPTPFVGFSRLKGLAPDGRCKSFSAAADGTAWAEGCGVLVLKRLVDAVAEGDNVVGVIRGSAVNQDGRSNGLTAPSGPAQRGVVRSALDRAGVLPDEIDYVECHGTGTPLGDPIEALALDAALGRERESERPLWIGSVKSNLGHTQAAAGIAGVIKTLLAIKHQEIPPTLHCAEPSPHIPWERTPLVVASSPVPWPAGSRPRIGGVSSFGISGTNVHVVLEEPPARKEDAGTGLPAVAPLVLSGRGEESLRAQARRWAEWIDEVSPEEWGDLIYSSAVFKSHYETRATVISSEPDAAREALAALKELWTKDEAEFHGRYYDFPPVYSYPKPVQKPHPPVLLGGNAPNVLRRVARHADGWLPVGATPSDVEKSRKILDTLAVERGRDPASLSISVFAMPVATTRDQVDSFLNAGAERVAVWPEHRESEKEMGDELERMAEALVR